MRRLENKVVLITGGASGIGKACALSAVNEGAQVALLDIENDLLSETMDALLEVSPTAIFIPCDVSVFAQVQLAMDTVIQSFGRLDVALNNAGIGGKSAVIGDMSLENWLEVMGVNLNGVFNCMKFELQEMLKQQHGVIVNMSSILGKVGIAGSAHYVAAKHGVIGLTQTAALEYSAKGIRINAICPGFIDTPLLKKVGIDDRPEVKQRIIGLHPMQRLGKSEEIANAFIFLASDESSFITGTSLEIEGGYLAQ
ncbi:MAG: SDR family oxidoreductase [Saprospiraceae bacterium]|nr:SDR family oxidoreductase [Saprospiraceae bacterium]